MHAGAKVVTVSLPPETIDLSIVKTVLESIEVVGSLVGTHKDFEEAFQFVAESKVVPIVKICKLDEVNDIFEVMEKGKIFGRMVVDMHKY